MEKKSFATIWLWDDEWIFKINEICVFLNYHINSRLPNWCWQTLPLDGYFTLAECVAFSGMGARIYRSGSQRGGTARQGSLERSKGALEASRTNGRRWRVEIGGENCTYDFKFVVDNKVKRTKAMKCSNTLLIYRQT